MSNTIKIIFMGTPDFAVPALQKLLDEPTFEVVAIYSKEPKISGRGHKIQNSQIHDFALKFNEDIELGKGRAQDSPLQIITPKSLRNNEIQKEFADLNADIAVVVAYGLILPKEILNAPKFGCINIHPSLLPRWRGAAPLQRTLMAGDIETAVDIIAMDEGLDSGDILNEEKFALDDAINLTELAEKTAQIGANLLIKTIKDLVSGKCRQAKKQNDEMVVYASKILKEEFKIDWNLSAREIHNKIRGLSGCGSSYFELQVQGNKEKIKIHKAQIINEEDRDFDAGKILNEQLHIACKSGIIQPLILQRSGKNKVTLNEFLRGFSIVEKL